MGRCWVDPSFSHLASNSFIDLRLDSPCSQLFSWKSLERRFFFFFISLSVLKRVKKMVLIERSEWGADDCCWWQTTVYTERERESGSTIRVRDGRCEIGITGEDRKKNQQHRAVPADSHLDTSTGLHLHNGPASLMVNTQRPSVSATESSSCFLLLNFYLFFYFGGKKNKKRDWIIYPRILERGKFQT